MSEMDDILTAVAPYVDTEGLNPNQLIQIEKLRQWGLKSQKGLNEVREMMVHMQTSVHEELWGLKGRLSDSAAQCMEHDYLLREYVKHLLDMGMKGQIEILLEVSEKTKIPLRARLGKLLGSEK